VRAFQRQEQPALELEAPASHARVDAIRSWLATGMHTFAIDPRRRRGHHPRARQLLADDRRTGATMSGNWQSLASALDRHTVRSGMSELSPEERKVITLAYLEGRTNREIASILGVSLSTVRRRLWAALKRLDAYISRTGTWLSAILVFSAAYVLGRLTRLVGTGGWTQRLVSAVAVTATVAAVGLAAVSPDAVHPGRSPATTPPQARAAGTAVGVVIVAPGLTLNLGPAQKASIITASLTDRVGRPVLSVPPLPVTVAPPELNGIRGCHGNPTSAAPPTPVGRHSGGSPVSHPGKGGCHA
jgi:RNA polymerase sigma factor (sigma-70 family)